MEMDNESLAKSILKSANSRGELDVMSAGKDSVVKSKQD